MSRELELYADLLYTDLRKCLKDNRRNFRKALNKALAEGFDVNYVPSNLNFAYFSLLDTALYDYNFIKNPDEVISLLLEAGADVNLKDRYRSTPIFTAALHAPPHIIHMMLQRTTDINIVSNDGHTVLQFLIWRYMDAYSRYSSAQFIQLIKEVLDKYDAEKGPITNYARMLLSGRRGDATSGFRLGRRNRHSRADIPAGDERQRQDEERQNERLFHLTCSFRFLSLFKRIENFKH